MLSKSYALEEEGSKAEGEINMKILKNCFKIQICSNFVTTEILMVVLLLFLRYSFGRYSVLLNDSVVSSFNPHDAVGCVLAAVITSY